MTSQGLSFKLGLFVIGGLAIGIATVIALGAGAFLKRKQPLYCYFTESVKGLETDSAVTYRGVKIGRVVRVVPQRPGDGNRDDAPILAECEVDPELLGIVDAGIFTNESDVRALVAGLVDDGLRVQLSWGDLIGSKYLELDFVAGADAAAPPLPFEPLQPYVPTYAPPSLSDIQQGVFDALQSISQVQYREISSKLVRLLDRLEAKTADADVAGISERTTAALDAARDLLTSGELNRSVTRLDTITADLEVITGRLRRALEGERVERLFDDSAQAMASLRRISADLETSLPRTLGKVDGLIETLDTAVEESRLPETTASLRTAAGDAGSVARDVSALRTELSVALRDLSAAGRSVSRLARTLEERPDSLLRGKPPEDEEPR